MATIEGSWVSYNGRPLYRVMVENAQSSYEQQSSVSMRVWLEFGTYLWPSPISKSITIVTTLNGVAQTSTSTINYVQGGTQTLVTRRSTTVTKTHAKQNVGTNATVSTSTSGGYNPTSSTASGTVSVSAKTSYKVTFDANGGDASSLPSAQTKWYNEDLTLSSTVPKRAGCTFLGWNTAKNGTGTHYASGADYTANAALKLYAIWLGVSVPTITAERTDSEGAEADEGTYGTLAATWQAVGSPSATVTVTARNVTAGTAITLSGDTSATKAAGKSATGAVSALFGGSLSTDTRYRVTVTVTVSTTYGGTTRSVTATATAYVSYAYITMDALAGGHGVAFGKTAVREGMDIAMAPIYLAEAPRHDTDGAISGAANVITGNSGVTSITGATAYRWGKLLMLYANWTNDSAIEVPASGNITNVVVGTLVEGLRPAILCAGTSRGDNAGQCFYQIATNGTIQLGAVEGTGAARTIAAGTTFNLHAVYILA